jgi:hypothetical protein
MSLPRKNREGIVAVRKKNSDKVVPYWTPHSKLCGFRTGKYYTYEGVFGKARDESGSQSSESDTEVKSEPIE